MKMRDRLSRGFVEPKPITDMQNKISLFSLVLLIVAAIDSIRTLPTTALFGSSLVFFFLVSAVIFLIPIALISAEFSSRYPEQGGIFHWIREAFGERPAVLAVWLQWINTMVWYPTMLLFIAGTGAYLLDPMLANNKIFLVAMTVFLFWGLTLLNLKGIRISAKINSYCGTMGILLPMLFLIALGIWWVLSENPVSISFAVDAMIPSFSVSENGGAIVTIMASFLGMELAGVHVNDIQNPQKNFPKALGYSVIILLSTLIFGAISIAIVIPKNELHFVDGVMQTFTSFFNAFHIPFLIPVLAALIILGSVGGSINWLLSPAKGLVQAAEYGFLPPYLIKKNKSGVAVRILIIQAIFVTLLCLSINLMPSINTFYWFLMALSTGLYMLMYVMLFLAALKLGRPSKYNLIYRIPRGVRTLSCLFGLTACLITIFVGFHPSPGMNIGSNLIYAGLIAAGFIIMLAPVLFLWIYKARTTSSKNLT